MASRTLQIVIAGDSKSAEKAMRDAEVAAGGLEAKLGRIADGMKSWGDGAVDLGKKLSVNVSLPLVAAGVFAVKSASDMAESQNKVQVVFDKSSAAIERWAASSARSLGLSRAATFESVGTFGNLFRAMDVAEPKAAKMSMRFVELAADLASFNNANPTDVLEALRSGLVGEAEPLRKFGVSLSAARIEAKALELGLGDTKDELTAGAKAQAAYAIIMEDTKLAQGDFARTSDGLANRLRIVRAEATDAAADFGTIVVPAVALAAGWFADMASAVAAAPEPVQKVAIALAAFLAVAGPVVLVSGKIAQGAAAVIKGWSNMAEFAQTVALKSMYAVDALKAMSAAQVASATAATLGVAALGALAYVIANSGRSFDDASADGAKAADRLVRDAKRSTDEIATLRAQINEIKRGAAAGSLDSVNDVGEFSGKLATLAQALYNAKQEQKDAEAADKARRASLLAVADGTQNLTTATDDAKNAIMQLQSQVLAASGGELGYQQSLMNQQKAQEDLNKAIEEHGVLSQETAAAVLAKQQADLQATSAALGLDDANTALVTTLLETPEAFAAEIAKLEEAKKAHPEVADAIQVQIDKLVGLKQWIDNIPDTKRTVFTADTSAFDLAISHVKFALGQAGGFVGAVISAVTQNPEGAGAEGAIVNRPTLALIGEAGPEALVPLHRTAGNGPLPASLGAGPAGDLVLIVQLDGQAIGQASIKDINRRARGGPVIVRTAVSG